MTAPVRVVVVGCGDIAMSGHLPALARNPDTTVVGVIDPVQPRRAAAACTYATRELPDLAAACDAGAQAAVVATPPEITPRLTVEAVGLGLDVLCEKPMAVRLDQAVAVRSATREAGRIVQVGFKNRFSPLVRKLRQWLSEGRLGRPIAFTLGGFDERYDPTDQLHTQRIFHFLEEGPSFLHEGAHFADYLSYLTGAEPVAVHAVGLRSHRSFPAENFVSALVRYDNGDVARLEIGWLFPTSPAGEFRALGPDGVAVVDRPNGVARLTTREGVEEQRLDRPWNDACFDAQLDHFVHCVRCGHDPETSVDAGIASLRLGRTVVDTLRSQEVER